MVEKNSNVKWKMPGKNLTARICGHMYQGDVVYDNALTKLPLKDIEPFIIKESKASVKEDSESEIGDSDPVVEPEKPKVEEPEVVEDGPEAEDVEDSSDALKDTIKNQFSVRELKEKAKEMGLSGYSRLNEDNLVDLLVKNGFKG